MPVSDTQTREPTDRRIAADLREASPSTGSREVYVLMEAAGGLGDRGEVVATLDADGDSQQYLKDFFQVTS